MRTFRELLLQRLGLIGCRSGPIGKRGKQAADQFDNTMMMAVRCIGMGMIVMLLLLLYQVRKIVQAFQDRVLENGRQV